MSSLTLENEQHWETYRVGSSCITGGNNLFLSDVNDDGRIEILVGGYTYQFFGEQRVSPETSLTIWNRNGDNLTRRDCYNWNSTLSSTISCVYAADANGDGCIEILAGRRVTNESTVFTQLSVYSWNGTNLIFETGTGPADLQGSTIRSIFVSDLDNDGVVEIISCGRTVNDTKNVAHLKIWHLTDGHLRLQKSVEWCAAKDASANTVYAQDLDGDGVVEIVTGGYDNDLNNSCGQIRIWTWAGQEFLLKASREWQMVEGVYGQTIAGGVMGNTVVNNLKVGDIDGDGTAEVVTGGFTYDGENVNAQIRVWNFTDDTLSLKGSYEWISADISEVKGISLNDVDGDGEVEIVSAGIMGVYGSFFAVDANPVKAQLRVWGWDGNDFTLKVGTDWYIDEGASAQNLATGDVDNDGVIEILTVGCSNLGALCDPDMRIWSIKRASNYPPYFSNFLIAFAGIVIMVLVALLVYVVMKRRK